MCLITGDNAQMCTSINCVNHPFFPRNFRFPNNVALVKEANGVSVIWIMSIYRDTSPAQRIMLQGYKFLKVRDCPAN